MKIRKTIATALAIAYIGLTSIMPAKAETTGNLNLMAHYDTATEQTEPLAELWLMKTFPRGLTGELYAETIAEDGDINGVYAELTGYHNTGEHFKVPGFGPWIEYVAITDADDIARGGLMWQGSPWKNAFLLARAGYGTNMEGNDITARIIFNQDFKKGSLGFMVNSQSIASGHIYSEIPRISVRLTDNIDLTAEGMYNRSVIDGVVNENYGVRGGVKIKF